MKSDDSNSFAFPLGTEGPFFKLQVALRLANGDPPPIARRVLAGILISWVPLLILCLIQPDARLDEAGVNATSSLLTHISVYARFFVTLPLLIYAENAVRPQLEQALRQAVVTGLIPPDRQAAFADLLITALKWRESRLAETVMIALAYLVGHFAIDILTARLHSNWTHVEGTLTWAGVWYAYVSTPLLQFMGLRWVYRLLIWWRVMRGMARLNLAIKPAHPDQRGGLAFLGDSIEAFAILAFAFSATAAGAVADFVVNAGADMLELKGTIGGAALIILVMFISPLLFFFSPMLRAKEHALLAYEGLAERYFLAFDRKWLASRSGTPEPPNLAEADFSGATDLISLVKGVREMKYLPVTKEGLLPLVIAVILPFLPLIAVAMPVQELLGNVLKLLVGA